MKRIIARSVGLGGVLLAVVSLSFAGSGDSKAKAAGTPLLTDWSHRHVIFSRPAAERAARVHQDFRYVLQQQRENVRPTVTKESWDYRELHRFRRRQRRIPKLHPDWAVDLGPGATVGAARFPAKYSFDTSIANCALSATPDFIVYGTGVPGVTATQGSIVAFTNLYNGCPTGPVPGDYWSYNTGGTVNTSPVLSRDGAQIAFTQTVGGVASLVLLKWLAFDGLVQIPTDLVPVLPSLYPTCPAPCMTAFSLGANDTNSSVYYNYGTDQAFVGDDAGNLHQFTGVFKGTPAEVVGGGWPATVGSVLGPALTSPVYDNVTGNTFVEDSDGFLYSVDASGGVIASAQLDIGVGPKEGPVIDPSIGAVYVFAADDGLGSASVYQLSTTLTSGDQGTEALVGSPTAGSTPLYDGGFDHNYLVSPDATGNLYVCGNPGGQPTLYQVSIQAGALTSSSAGPIIGTTTETPCSPVTDVYNPNVTGAGLPQEWVFMSVQGAGAPAGCGGFACVMNFKVTQWQPSTVYNKGQEILDSNLSIQVAENSGTSGTTQPAWNTNNFGPTPDGTVHWRNQGALSGQSPPSWVLNNTYPGAFKIIDSNNNIEIAQLPGGTSGATMPTWGLNEGDLTTDGTVTWVNLGANPVSGLAESGGTSGIIIDNTVNFPGASQVYFSTLQDQACPTSGGTGGCAVQASQQALK